MTTPPVSGLNYFEIEYYLERIRKREYFCFPGYSDAEWYCMLGYRVGGETALGQKITKEQGTLLLKILKRKHTDPRWLFAMPEALWTTVHTLKDGKIPHFFKKQGLTPC